MKIYANAAFRTIYGPAHKVADSMAYGLEGNEAGGITIAFITEKVALHGRYKMSIDFTADELTDLARAAANHELQVKLEQLESELEDAREEIERLRDC